MRTITKENFEEFCRTCLQRIGDESNSKFFKEEGIPNATATIAIVIETNEDLKELLRKYFGINFWQKDEYLPPSICYTCYDKIHGFNNFSKVVLQNDDILKNSIMRLQLQEDPKVTKLQDPVLKKTPYNRNEDIYKMLLKDTLMETESILLDSLTITASPHEDINDPILFTDGKISTDKYNSLQKKKLDESSGSNPKIPSINLDAGHEHSDVDVGDCRSKNMTKNPQNIIKNKLILKEKGGCITSNKDQDKNNRRNKVLKNTFKCMECKHSFAHKITLDAHIRKIHEGNKKPFQCDRCEKSYTFIGGLYTHIKEIHETTVRSYSCDSPGCDRIYTSSIAMQKHKRLKHTETGSPMKYVCEQCGATFNQIGNLKCHRRTKHPTEAEKVEIENSKERFSCDICKKLFHSQYTLKYHTLQLHSNDMKFECTICGRRMAKKFMLVQHMLIHSKNKLPCEHCGKQFNRKFELETHIRAVHMKLKPFECQYCAECFASRKTLRHHEYIHTGKKPYICDICGQAFRQQTCLKNHRKLHQKEFNTETTLSNNIH